MYSTTIKLMPLTNNRHRVGVADEMYQIIIANRVNEGDWKPKPCLKNAFRNIPY